MQASAKLDLPTKLIVVRQLYDKSLKNSSIFSELRLTLSAVWPHEVQCITENAKSTFMKLLEWLSIAYFPKARIIRKFHYLQKTRMPVSEFFS